MQFIPDGPDVPENLIAAHEEGKVVFFCGAGISMSAGLPSFRKLAETIIDNNENLFKIDSDNNLDRAFQLFEDRLFDGRYNLLEKLWDELNIKKLNEPEIHYHKSLLTLARSKSDNRIRLVTTNFDRIFQKCNSDTYGEPEALVAPRLPVPKPNRWDGIVYLHGMLPEEKEDLGKTDNLVITSGDFGQAYLIERWAARFITELFRNYEVCFVGYSLNDPVMRYLTDALVKDESMGINFKSRYIFLPINQEFENEKENTQWFEKKLETIYYNIIDNDKPHIYLEKTLYEWASAYSDGLNAKKEIIFQYLSLKLPKKIEKKQLLWALRDPMGAEYFANNDPCPPIDIIDVLDSEVFKYNDLLSFGHKWLPEKAPVNFPKFSLLRQKARFEQAQFLSPFDESECNFLEDNPSIEHFNKWIVRHLDKPYLAIWMASKDKPLGSSLKKLIFEKLKEDKNCCHKINNYMQIVWELFLSDSVTSNKIHNVPKDWYSMKKRFDLFGLTPSLKSELKYFLRPILCIDEYPSENYSNPEEKNDSINDSLNNVSFSVDVGYEHIAHDVIYLSLFGVATRIKISLEDRMFYFKLLTDALEDMFDLIKLLYGNDNFLISRFSDNIHNLDNSCKFQNWTSLAFNLQKLWRLIVNEDKKQALFLLSGWQISSHYPLNRLFLICINDNIDFIDADYVFKHLVDNNEHLLLVDYPEKLILLLKYSNKFNNEQLIFITSKLISSVANLDFPITFSNKTLPNNQKYREDYKNNFRPHKNVLLSLKNIEEGGSVLPPEASIQLNKYKKCKAFKFIFKENKPYEIVIPDNESSHKTWIKFLQTSVEKINEHTWSTQDPLGGALKKTYDPWIDFCKDNPSGSFEIIKQLKKLECWNEIRCRTMLNCWIELARQNSSKDIKFYNIKLIYIDALIYLIELDSIFFDKISHEVISLAKGLIFEFYNHKKIEFIFILVNKLIKSYPTKNTSQLVNFSQALNHPLGIAIELLLDYQLILNSKNTTNILMDNVKNSLNELIKISGNDYNHVICMIAYYTYDLYSLDSKWAETTFLPLFDWKKPEVAKFAWLGYFYDARKSPNLLKTLHDPLLATGKHLDEIDQNHNVYPNLICTIALGQVRINDINARIFTNIELRECIKNMNGYYRSIIVQIIANLMADVSEKPELFWDKSVKPFFVNIWPNEKQYWDNSMQIHFEKIIVASSTKFLESYEMFYRLLKHCKEFREDPHFASPLILDLESKFVHNENDKYNSKLSSNKKLNFLQKFPKECLLLIAVSLNGNNFLTYKKSTILKNFLMTFDNKLILKSPEFTFLLNLAEKNIVINKDI